MSIRRKFLLIFCFIVLDMFLLVGFLVIRDATLLNDLEKEVYELSKLDITKDRFNRSIKSRGNYAIVEKAIKEYLDNYATSLQEISDIVNSQELKTILSYDNYLKDGPEFKKSLSYLKNTKEEFNQKLDRLITNLDEDKITNYINKKITDPYYVNLYKDLMLGKEMTQGFNETEKTLNKLKISINNVLDVSLEVLSFLVTNKDSWELENGEIKFMTNDLYTYYNTLIGKI